MPSLNAELSTIPVLDDSTATIVPSVLHDEPPVLQSCLEIPTPAHVDSHDSAMGDLMDMVRRSDDE